jgi:hypothetical protein
MTRSGILGCSTHDTHAWHLHLCGDDINVAIEAGNPRGRSRRSSSDGIKTRAGGSERYDISR